MTLDPLTLFYRTAGETPASFHRGTEVEATVTRIQGDQRVLLRLDNGLPGYIDREDFPARKSYSIGGFWSEGRGSDRIGGLSERDVDLLGSPNRLGVLCYR